MYEAGESSGLNVSPTDKQMHPEVMARGNPCFGTNVCGVGAGLTFLTVTRFGRILQNTVAFTALCKSVIGIETAISYIRGTIMIWVKI